MAKTGAAHKIGISYERSFKDGIKRKTRDREGIFYTPPNLAEFTVNRVLSYWQPKALYTKLAPLTILDPSCGSGAFLIECAANLSRIMNPEHFLLCGVDKDFNGVEQSQKSLNKLNDKLRLNIIGGNSLISKTPETNIDSLSPVDWTTQFPEASSQGGFHIIIGNPPYGLSRGDKFHPLEKKIIEARYSWIKRGKLNKYIAFTALSYEQLKPGGIAALIIPNSWLGIESGEKLRTLLLETGALTEIIVLPKSAFADPSVETVILIFQKPTSANHDKTTFRIEKLGENLKTQTGGESHVSINDCLRLPSKVIPVNFNKSRAEIIEKIFKNSLLLGAPDSLFTPRIALQAYSVGKGTPQQTESNVKQRIYDTFDPKEANAVPYLNSKDIGKFSINWSGLNLKWGPWLAEPQRLERFSCPRILIREILDTIDDPIVATFTNKMFLYNKSVIHISHKLNEEDDLLALLAILSSRLAALLINTLGRKSQRRLFPKLVLADLNSFPLPWSFQDGKNELAKLTKMLLNVSENNQTAEIRQTINRRVCELYHINSEKLILSR
jgi:methylase of polypeptide subunit release factors